VGVVVPLADQKGGAEGAHVYRSRHQDGASDIDAWL